ncbi:hypothetical protein [Solilutibacter silvestris]|uniref:hypothetical protein n=1 Tax=Solilutibacter silvestris TaxID=1645665 RepID=UPI00101AEB7F|nr:hypothetical protein [Lysobacter silvestris]
MNNISQTGKPSRVSQALSALIIMVGVLDMVDWFRSGMKEIHLLLFGVGALLTGLGYLWSFSKNEPWTKRMSSRFMFTVSVLGALLLLSALIYRLYGM